MSLLVTCLLTLACAAVVAVTRRLLHHRVPGSLLGLHTVLGGLGALLWLVFLIVPGDQALIGVVGLGCWWVVSVVGLLLLTRWLPSRRSRGKRAGTSPRVGVPWLSILAHVGVFCSVVWFTYAYVTGRV